MSQNISLFLFVFALSAAPVSCQYKYRLMQPQTTSVVTQHRQAQYYPPAPVVPAHQRTARHYDTQDKYGLGPYLQKDSFFNTGFLKDLLGLARPEVPTYPLKREIQQSKPRFPSFFTPEPVSKYQVYPAKQEPNYPTKSTNQKYLKKNNSRYGYTVKGASTHYVDNKEPRPPHEYIQPSPPVHAVQMQPYPKHFTTKSSYLQSSRNPGAPAASVSVKSFNHVTGHHDHSNVPVSITAHTAADHHQVTPFVHHSSSSSTPTILSPKVPSFSSPTFSDSKQSSYTGGFNQPTMEELLHNIDTKTKSYVNVPEPTKMPADSLSSVKTSSYSDFKIEPNTNTIITDEKPRKDVFQLFQKLPEKFSLVTDVTQQTFPVNTDHLVKFADVNNVVRESPSNTSPTTTRINSDTAAHTQHQIKTIEPDIKVRQSFYSSTTPRPTTTSSSSSLLVDTTAAIESKSVRKRAKVSGTRLKNFIKSKQKPIKNVHKKSIEAQTESNKDANFASFPYRDSIARSRSKPAIKKSTRNRIISSVADNKIVSLEDKQEKKQESLQRLLDIAGVGWSEDNNDNQQEQQQDTFTCPEPEGHFGDSFDCSVYYRCVHGKWTRLRCGAGLVWDNVSGQCDWEQVTGCHV